MNIAINGFGRIGRNAFKIICAKQLEGEPINVVAINDLTNIENLSYLLSHDSIYGKYYQEVSFDDNGLIVGGQKIKVCNVREPSELPWKDLEIDVVLECTGLFTSPTLAKKHLEAGAKKVIVSAPFKLSDQDLQDSISFGTYVMGVNEHDYKGELILSNGSCTTNCVTPLLDVLNREFGIEKSMMTTIHSYTASQVLQDGPSKELRESRGAAMNIIPTTTGASKSVSQVLTDLSGKFTGMSVRVPSPIVSLVDLVCVLKRNTNISEVNEVLAKGSKSPDLLKIINIAESNIVSSDVIGNASSALVDLALTDVVGGDMVKVVAWYDNEWGYSNRLVDLAEIIAKNND